MITGLILFSGQIQKKCGVSAFNILLRKLF